MVFFPSQTFLFPVPQRASPSRFSGTRPVSSLPFCRGSITSPSDLPPSLWRFPTPPNPRLTLYLPLKRPAFLLMLRTSPLPSFLPSDFFLSPSTSLSDSALAHSKARFLSVVATPSPPLQSLRFCTRVYPIYHPSFPPSHNPPLFLQSCFRVFGDGVFCFVEICDFRYFPSFPRVRPPLYTFFFLAPPPPHGYGKSLKSDFSPLFATFSDP